jgi:hypothetical protein
VWIGGHAEPLPGTRTLMRLAAPKRADSRGKRVCQTVSEPSR